MITFACVLYQGEDVPEHSKGIFSAEWADRLYRGIKRNCTRPFRFVCYCDDDYEFSEPVEARRLELPYRNMFSLLEVFREDLGRVVFMGLDTIIVGNIDHLADYDGPFAMLPDPYFARPCSGVMAFPYTPEVWQAFVADHERHAREQTMFGVPSDMIYLATVPHELLDDTGIYSYKAHCQNGVPDDACIVYFHGDPKPHQLNEAWIEKHWGSRVKSEIKFVEGLNTPIETMVDQARINAKRGLPWISEIPAHNRRMAIAGGGPSLADTFWALPKAGDIYALNGAHDYLIERGIIPDYMVLLDSREVNAKLVQKPHKDVHYLIAATVHPAVLDALEGYQVSLWAPLLDNMHEATGAMCLVGGGATVAMKALYLGHTMGYRSFHLFGCDSSYREGRNHAYTQDFDTNNVMPVQAGDREFYCEPWMAKQALEFQQQAKHLSSLGCFVSVHGDGLLPHVAKLMNGEMNASHAG